MEKEETRGMGMKEGIGAWGWHGSEEERARACRCAEGASAGDWSREGREHW